MTRDEALDLMNAYAEVVASNVDPEIEGIDDDGAAFDALIAALTAPPEKPKVDVRKVWAHMQKHADTWDGVSVHTQDGLSAALRACGAEVVP